MSPKRTSSSDNTARLAPGELIHRRWRLEERLGQGAMGIVFAGFDISTKTSVAIKFLSPEHGGKPKLRTRFEREALAMEQLRHPNIVSVVGHGMHGTLPFIVMEYLQGRTLSEVRIAAENRLDVATALPLLTQLGHGLTFLHKQGFVHRDLKPQNIFICDETERVVILDFGAVRNVEVAGLTRPGAMLGTPYYMSPEQILGVKDIDFRTDIYALGAVTFELLTGQPPFPGKSSYVVLTGHKNSTPPFAHDIEPTLSADISRVLLHALAKRREERPASAEEFIAALTRAAQRANKEERTQLIAHWPHEELAPDDVKTVIVKRPRKP